MRFLFTIILTALLYPLCPVMAQGEDFVEKDSVFPDIIFPDSLYLEEISIKDIQPDTIQQTNIIGNSILLGKETDKNIIKNNKPAEFKPDPTKAVIYSMIFPGLGQIYNRKYWKLRIVYGGFMGCAYAITWNGAQYNGYKQGYRDIADNDPNTNSWHNYLRFGVDPGSLSASEITMYTNAFRNKKDFYRRNRDLSIIVTIGVYALCMLDAYVDAQLFDFDINPDLSMKVEPVFYNRTEFSSRSLGLQCSIKF